MLLSKERLSSMFPRVRQFVRERPVLRRFARFLRYAVLGHRDEQWCRVVINRETLRIVDGLRPETLDVLEISGGRWTNLRPFRSYRGVHYPDYDVCSCALPDRFDLVIAEQVFEHLRYPHRAAANVRRMVREGGYFLITTPFLLKIHNYPEDCTRWSEVGLRHFLGECGFDERRVSTGSWGNRRCVVANFGEYPYYNRRIHSLRNEAEFPIAVWALART
jgi:SAM-dependent methyltransferase